MQKGKEREKKMKQSKFNETEQHLRLPKEIQVFVLIK